MYQRFLLDDVALRMIYKASDKSIGERVNFKKLDNYLKSNFINNGVELLYHFSVIDKDGREVYRCSDYEDGGSEDSYTQPLFQNDPPAKMSIVKVDVYKRQVLGGSIVLVVLGLITYIAINKRIAD